MTQCIRCRSKTLTENDFAKDKNDAYLKTCNQCRENDKQRKDNNRESIRKQSREHYQQIRDTKREQVKQWNADNKDKLTEIVVCKCGGKFQHKSNYRHIHSARHKTYLETATEEVRSDT